MYIRISVVLSLAATPCLTAGPSTAVGVYRTAPSKVRDVLWVWSTPKTEQRDLRDCRPEQFVQAPAHEKLKLLGVSNVLMAGNGLPSDFAEATRLSDTVADAANVVWEVMPDGATEYAEGEFVYEKRLADIRRLVEKYPNQVGILLDDLSSVALSKGYDPATLEGIRRQLGPRAERIKLWSVVYTKDLDKPGVDKLMEYSDVVNLWEWFADRTVALERNVALVERKQPGKPIMLGLYLHDYGAGRPLSLDLMKRQCRTALELAHEGRIQGIVFLSIDNNAEIVDYLVEWVGRVGDQVLGQPVVGEERYERTFPGFDFSMGPDSRPDRYATWLLEGDGYYEEQDDDAFWLQGAPNSHWICDGEGDPAFAANQGVVRCDVSMVFEPGTLGRQADFSNWRNYFGYASPKQALQFCVLPTDNGSEDRVVVYTHKGERYLLFSPAQATDLDDGRPHTYSVLLNFDQRRISFRVDDAPLCGEAGETTIDLETVRNEERLLSEFRFGGGTRTAIGEARFTGARLAIVSPEPERSHRVRLRPPEEVDDDGNRLREGGRDVFQTDGSLQGYQLRFNTDRAYRDFEANFTISMPSGHADIGLIVRAQDPRHYYLVHFPQSGQSFRAQHFWGAVSKADGSGFLRILSLRHIRRVASNPFGLRHQVKVRAAGSRIQVWVNGFEAMEVVDDSYQEGYLGLSGFCSHRHGRVRITGEPVEDPPPFDTSNVQPPNWFEPFGDLGGRHVVPKAALTPRGNLVCLVHAAGGYRLARSDDRGRTWMVRDAPEAFATGVYGDDYGTLYTDLQSLDDGTMVAIHLAAKEGEELPNGFRAVSADDGLTWTRAELKSEVPWKRGTKSLSTGWMFRLRNGDLIRFGLGSHRESGGPITKWGSVHVQGFAIRSSDGGVTWSAPANLDGDEGTMGNLDLTEPVGFERADGKLMALIRPVYSPWMWETWSHDGGRTWGPCVRGPFPGYAPSVPVRTESGVVMFPVRFPGLTIHSTTDDGMTWDGGGGGTYIDTSIWAMGSMVEVEPNLVLFLYMDSFGGKTRAQYIRVLPDGTLHPATKATERN